MARHDAVVAEMTALLSIEAIHTAYGLSRALFGVSLEVAARAAKGLAPLIVEALLAKIGELKRQGLTILLAEQGVQFSLALADRVYMLEKGSVRYTGPAAALRDDKQLSDRLLAL